MAARKYSFRVPGKQSNVKTPQSVFLFHPIYNPQTSWGEYWKTIDTVIVA